MWQLVKTCVSPPMCEATQLHLYFKRNILKLFWYLKHQFPVWKMSCFSVSVTVGSLLCSEKGKNVKDYFSLIRHNSLIKICLDQIVCVFCKDPGGMQSNRSETEPLKSRLVGLYMYDWKTRISVMQDLIRLTVHCTAYKTTNGTPALSTTWVNTHK